MASELASWRTIINRVGLLGASIGLILGLLEADFLRRTYMPLPFLRPHVPGTFWFFAPLLSSLTFGLLGLLAGALASLPKSRFLAMVIIAGFTGFTGLYLALVLQYTQAGTVWYPTLEGFIKPELFFSAVFAWTLAALWSTRTPDSPLGFLSKAPKRFWEWSVIGSMAALLIAVGISNLPEHLTGSTAHATGRAQSPNIVLIIWDTTRADHLSSYGYSRNTTPNVDQFAQRGVLFENAISASSWTLPAMASVFTSLLPHQHGAGSAALGKGPRTLAEILAMGGYETAGFNGNSIYGVPPWGLTRGFETYTDSTTSLGYSLDATRIGRRFVEPVSEDLCHRSRFYQLNAHDLNAHVYRWFNHRSDRPYFLFLNYNDAHEPYESPSPYDHLYGSESSKIKYLLHTTKPARLFLPTREREGSIAAYDDCLHYIDSQVGQLLRFLEQSPDWSNTYVIITSDHGEGFGEHGTYTHAWNLYREVVHVPLIIAGPGVPAGVRVKEAAQTQHIFPTVLQWAGIKQAVLRRASLARMWTPDSAPTPADGPAVSEVLDNTAPPAPQGMISVATQDWQLICRPGDHRNELYHWSTDPLEQRNLADAPENQALVGSLQASLVSIIRNSYRPWRDTGYLEALSAPDFSPDVEATKLNSVQPGGPFLLLEAGAAQMLFPQNPDAHHDNSDEELLKSLPYDAH